MDVVKELEERAAIRQDAINKAIDGYDSPVQQFYRGATVFMTGGSGFLGKQLIEKLLRSCEIKKIYLLMRPKKGRTTEGRIQHILKDRVFESLREKQPNFADKIFPINGDVIDIKLGVSHEDWTTLTDEVDTIFHGAATVRFDSPLRTATLTNVRGTREVVTLAKSCQNLKSFVYVSTAYTHATKDRVGKAVLEQFYECPVAPDIMIGMAEQLEESRLDNMAECLMNGWPNTYTFTKAIAEELIRNATDLPLGVVRPPIVIGSYTEPIPGWLDLNAISGPSGIILGIILGVLHTFYVSPKSRLPMTPVDYVNNCVIAAGWDAVANKNKRGDTEIPVYTVSNKDYYLSWVIGSYTEPIPGWLDLNAISGPSGIILGIILGVLHTFYVSPKSRLPMTPVDYVNNCVIAAGWDAVANKNKRGDTEIPVYTVSNKDYYLSWGFIGTLFRSETGYRLSSKKAVWYCFVIEVHNKFLYAFLSWFLHYIPAYIADAVCFITKKKPKEIPSFVGTYKKIDKFAEIYDYFLANEWDFKDDNLKAMCNRMDDADRVIYNCDVSTIDLQDFAVFWGLGIRKFIIQDKLEDCHAGYEKQKKLRIANYFVMSLYVFLMWNILRLFWYVIKGLGF